MLLTNLDNGDTQALCAQCAGPFFRTLAEALAPAAPEGPALGDVAGAVTAQEGEAAPDPPRPKRRRTGRQTASAALTSEASPFQEVTPDSE